MQTGFSSSLKFAAILACIVAGGASVFADDVAPPPGFVPGQEADSSPSAPPTPGFLQSQDARRRGDFNPGQTDYFPDADDRYQPYQPVQQYATPSAPVLFGPDVTP